MFSTDVLIIALAGFCSGIIKTGVGVGAGIFLLPTLALAFPTKLALGIGAPLMLASDVIGLKYYWMEWLPKQKLIRLFCAVIPGLILGLILLPLIPGRLFRIMVGLFGALYAISYLWPGFPVATLLKKIFATDGKPQTEASERRGMYFYGCLGGFATVLAHAGGLVWSLFLVNAAPDRRMFVGTTIILFFVTNIYKTVSYLCIDILTWDSLLQVLPAIPMVFLGSFLGNYLNKRCNPAVFRKIVLCFIFMTSVSLIIK